MKLLTLMICLLSIDAMAVTGTLKIDGKPVRVKRDDGFKARFYKGSYRTEISAKRRNLHFNVTAKNVRTAFTVNLPSGFSLPSNGSFTLPAKKTGQTFDLKGNIKTKTSKSPTVNEYEYCVYYEEEYVCRGRGRRRYCEWEEVAVDGEREVEYHFIRRKVNFNWTLSSPREGSGNFTGVETSKNKVYTYRGECE